MAIHELTPQLKKYITARLNDESTPITVIGMPIEGDDMPYILIVTGYAAFRVPSLIYQMTFQTYLHREPPGPGEGFRMNSDQRIDIEQQLQQWEQLKSGCRATAFLTPYLLETYKGRRASQLRLLWADPYTIWIASDVLNTVDVRWGELKAAATDRDPVYFQGTNIEAFFLPYLRWQKKERANNALLAQETDMARAWCARRTAENEQP